MFDPKKSAKRKANSKSDSLPERKRKLSSVSKEEIIGQNKDPKAFADSLGIYLNTVEGLSNESSRSHAFSMFLQQIFGIELEFISRYTSGIEKGLKSNANDQILRGRADNLFGNLVIEFERKLPTHLEEAVEQLRRYIAILWSNEKAGHRTPYIALAADGVRFYAFSPTADQSQKFFKPADIVLNKVDEVDWKQLSPSDVWMWLDRYLLREEPMIPQTDTIVRDFGIDSHVFRSVTSLLNSRWQHLKGISSFDVVYDSWEKYLRIVYGGDVGADELFIRHTYLATFAKLLSWVHISDSRHTPSTEEIDEVIGGDYFKKHGIENFIEEDFFSWITRENANEDGIKSVKWILSILRKYDLKHLSEDVLKSLYQELVDPSTRRYLGEFYTPDWLASKIVNEALDKKPGASILDPTCGSGTFLYLAVQKKRQILADGPGTLEHVLANVCGIDIHPLAVIIAKTNYMLALGELLINRKSSISIPVYLSDCVRLPEKGQMSVFMQVPAFKVQLDGKDVFLAEEFVKDYALYDQTIELARQYAVEHKNKPVDLKSFKRLLQVARYPRFTDDHFTRAAFEIAQVLKYFIDKERDSIWAYVLKNIYKPLFIKNQFDYILGNPPWLAYRVMERGYQESLKDLIVRQYKLYAGRSETMSSLEVATLFFLRSADLYLKQGGEILFVLPRSLFSSEQHDNVRRRRFQFSEDTNSTLTWAEIWDLKDVKPIFKIPCCVIKAKKVAANNKGSVDQAVPAKSFSGRLHSKNMRLDDALPLLSETPIELTTQLIGNRSFWAPAHSGTDSARSDYFELFGEGATLVPRSCWFVNPTISKLGLNSRCPALISEPQAVATAKEPYKDVLLTGNVESEFLYGTLTGSEVIPFGHIGMRIVVLPMIQSGSKLEILESKDARRLGYLNLSKWLQQVESIWNKKRRDKADRMTLYQRINHNNGITRQKIAVKHRVVYNGSGKNVSATVVSTEKELRVEFAGHELMLAGFITDHKLFYFETQNHLEAHYLTAILNSEIVNQLIKPMQSHGEHNPRDIHKKVLELPIPRFDPKDANHQKLAKLSMTASKDVESWLDLQTDIQAQSIAKTRKETRSLVHSKLEEIDVLVRQIFET